MELGEWDLSHGKGGHAQTLRANGSTQIETCMYTDQDVQVQVRHVITCSVSVTGLDFDSAAYSPFQTGTIVKLIKKGPRPTWGTRTGHLAISSLLNVCIWVITLMLQPFSLQG